MAELGFHAPNQLVNVIVHLLDSLDVVLVFGFNRLFELVF